MVNTIINAKNSSKLRSIIMRSDGADIFFEFCNLNEHTMDAVIEHTEVINESIYESFACYPITENGILVNYNLSVPLPCNALNMLMYIHGIIHGLVLQSRIGVPYEHTEYDEILPVVYEGVFINFLSTKGYSVKGLHREYIKYMREQLNDLKNNEQKTAYQNAYLLQECLLLDFITNPDKFLMNMKKIIRNEDTIENYLGINEPVKVLTK